MVAALNLYVVAFLLFLTHSGMLTGLLAGAIYLRINAVVSKQEDSYRGKLWALLSVPPLIVAAAFIALFGLTKLALSTQSYELLYKAWIFDAKVFSACAALSLAGAGIWLRQGVQKWDKLKGKLTVTSEQERNKKTDIREIAKFLPKNKMRFDPLKYIDFEKGIFVGLDEQDRPLYIDQDDWETSHLMLTGRTRSGKGVATQIIGAQSIMQGEFFVSLDPKCDNWMPHIFRSICKKEGKPYHFLDLRQAAPPQINLFRGCDAGTIENMLIGAFSLAEKGDIADHHRTNDRKAARNMAKWLVEKQERTIRDALLEFGEEWEESAKGFKEKLIAMAELPAVNRADDSGIDLDALAKSGGCLYVVGDMQNTRIVVMQRMILMRLMLLAKDRDTIDSTPPIIRVLADEFRVHISRPFIISLGASAGWRLLSILAFQSFGDLEDCPGDLSPRLVTKAALENCAIQLSYRIKDKETAEELASGTGIILVDDESRNVEKNLALSETVDDKRTIRQAERYLIDVNMIRSLPVPKPKKGIIGCGVILGVGDLAQFCFTSPIFVERTRAAITPTAPPCADAPTLSVAAAALDVGTAPATAAADIFGAAPAAAAADPFAPLPEPTEQQSFEDVEETLQSDY